jgi:hypothetical protein
VLKELVVLVWSIAVNQTSPCLDLMVVESMLEVISNMVLITMQD